MARTFPLRNRDVMFHYFKELKEQADLACQRLAKSLDDLCVFSIAVCNLAFTAEIGYKTILHHIKGEEHGHSLSDLDEAVRKTKRGIHLERKLGICARTMKRYLEQVDLNFQHWRYFYESENKKGETIVYTTNLRFLIDLVRAIYNCLEENTF